MMEQTPENSFYHKKLSRVRRTVYGNRAHTDKVVEIRHCIENNYHRDLKLDALSRIQLISKYPLECSKNTTDKRRGNI